MARLTISLVTLSLMIVLYSVPTLQHQVGERCWESWFRCSLHSAHGTHTKWEECNLRCQCLGYKSGYCWQTNDCLRGHLRWKCHCFGKSDFYTWPTCGEKKDADYE